ncbi:hypothetical protein SEVIR_9G141600v4 [Setaria viridis]|uniref:Uncharacterized protein n=1 Tax=Setaria viridis TaxID=4556 RepID=A0A4U6SXG2_SETVI|nr:uncharacterized protein LOC117837874 [Setaria viridis]TKV92102.1 hypothetical protein SEVIR_9G141600v2 [Setaria viridis]
MSIAAARSPSPGPASRPCCGGGGLRRSADSSPFRPAASPPDSPQRSSSVCKNSGSRASPRPCGAEKENDPRDAARTHKVRTSGGVGCGGGGGVSKSFMAPTISAASKAVAPSASPRKRILGERNDPVPSSPGDHLAHSSAKPRGPPPPPPEATLGAPRRLRLSLDGVPAPPPPAAAPVASHAARHSFGGDEEVGNPACKNRQDAGSAAAAPYDPKTNYLSPRPRFLRYKPNPRVEMYRHSSGGSVRRLEDRFASESSSTEEDVSEEEQEQTTLSSVADDFKEETSALAPAPEARAEPAASAVAGVLQPHAAPDSPLACVLTPEQESPRAGGVLTPEQEPSVSPAPARHKKKKRSPLRFLLAPLALVLFMAAAFVCVPPPPGSPVMLNTSLSKVSDFLSVQESYPVELAARLKQWSSSSLNFVTSYWEALASSQEQEVFGPHFVANLSAAPADGDAYHAVGFNYGSAQTIPIIVEQELEIQEVDSEMIADPDVESMAKFGDAEVEEPINDAEMEQEYAVPSVMEEADSSVDDAEVEEFIAEMAEEVSGSSGEEMAGEASGSGSEEMADFIQNSDIPSQSAAEPEQAEDMASLQQDVQTEDSEGDHADGKEDQEAHHGEKLGSDMWPSYLDKISNPATLGAALAAIIVPAALALLYMRQKQARVAMDSNEPVEQVEQVEQVGSLSGSGSSEGVAKSSRSQNPVVEETEKLGGSGASQYSSSLSSGLGRRRKAREEGSLGLEPVVSRRDSTAQSTASYGSFTTYEKIPAKKGNKEDEAMTPVRRSRRNVKPPEA